MLGNRKRSLATALVLACLFFVNTFVTYAALKDSDVDGITDEAEENAYHTDPRNHDTDGDGFDDGYEVVNNANPFDAKSDPMRTIRQEDTTAIRDVLTVQRIVWTAVVLALMTAFFLMASVLRWLAREYAILWRGRL